jgi:hypothetical protein
MAQWMGQFSGHTHATRVDEAEAALRHAVVVYRAATLGVERDKKAKAVKRLANRLLMARMKLIMTRIAAATDLQTGVPFAKRENEITPLELRYAKMREDGLDAIHREFESQVGQVQRAGSLIETGRFESR